MAAVLLCRHFPATEMAAGRLKAFYISDKCAAGSGIFLSNTLSMLGMDFGQICLYMSRESGIKLSSVCAVFAQSEIVRLLAANKPADKILESVIRHIFIKAKSLSDKILAEQIYLTGGLSQIRGIEEFAQLILEKKCAVLENAQYLSAIGCAVLSVKNK